MKSKFLKIFVIVIIILCDFIFFSLKSNYKKINIGNNVSNKTLDEYEKYILNISSYSATLEVEVKSNKNINKYVIKQQVTRRRKYTRNYWTFKY